MSKHDDYIWGRQSGLELALKIVREDGIAGLEKEVRYRGRTNINPYATVKELTQVERKLVQRTIYTTLLVTMSALCDLYGFGKTRIARLYGKITEGIDLINTDLATFDDYAEALKELHGIDIDWNEGRIKF